MYLNHFPDLLLFIVLDRRNDQFADDVGAVFGGFRGRCFRDVFLNDDFFHVSSTPAERRFAAACAGGAEGGLASVSTGSDGSFEDQEVGLRDLEGVEASF